MSDEENLEEQLRQEALEKVREEEETVEKELGQLYTDKDGVQYEWDAMKKAWFPKIDDDFIARYQMSYGTSTNADGENKETTATNDKAYEEYCKQYNDYYYSQGQGQEGTSNEGATSGDPNYDYYSYHGYDMSEYYAPQGDEEEGGDEGDAKDESSETKEEKKKTNAEKRKEPPTWFEAEPDHLPNVYVSGLPTDITEEEFIEVMSKYGLIVHDHEKKKPKVKLYQTKDGAMKGDGLCCYIKHESVDLALQILDESDVRGHKIHVERAKFVLKGDFDPSKRRKKLSNKQKRKLKEKQEKLFSWTPEKKETGRGKNEKVVILQKVFDPKEFEDEPTLINEIRADMRSECMKFGDVRKVNVHDRNPEGTVTIMFKTPEEADQCIAALNGRWFAGQQLSAFTWDGKTKYDLEETEEEKAKRLQEWERFLEAGENNRTKNTDNKETPSTQNGKEDNSAMETNQSPAKDVAEKSNQDASSEETKSQTSPSPDNSKEDTPDDTGGTV